MENCSVEDDGLVLKETVAYSGVSFALSETLTELQSGKPASDLGAPVEVWSVWTLAVSVEELFFKLQLSIIVWYISLPNGDLKIKSPSPDSQRRPAVMLNPSCNNSASVPEFILRTTSVLAYSNDYCRLLLLSLRL